MYKGFFIIRHSQKMNCHVFYDGTTNDNYLEIKKINELKSKSILCLRGEKLTSNNSYNSDNNGGAKTELFLSQDITVMRDFYEQLDKQLEYLSLIHI